MNIITLVILTLSLLLVNATEVQYCTDFLKSFNNNCAPSTLIIKNCCDLVELNKLRPGHAPSGVYKMRKGAFDNSVNVYCDLTMEDGLSYKETRRVAQWTSIRTGLIMRKDLEIL